MRGWLAAFCLLAVLAAPTLCAEERILKYRSEVRVQPDGRLLVTETLRVQVEGQQIRRGIYRDFPTRYRDRLGNNVHADFDVVSVRRDGGPEPWHTEQHPNGVRLYVGSAERNVSRGPHKYELVFLTDRQLGYFPDHDELYWNVTGNGWAFPIERVVVTISLPFRVAADQLQLAAYTGAFGARESDAQAEVLDASRVRFKSTRRLQAGEGMTVAVGWPKGLINEPGAGQKLAWFLTDNGAALILLLGLLAPLGWYLWAWNRVGRDPKKGVIIPRFEPPTGLSPAACRYVRDMSFQRDAFSAAVVSLAVKGQLVIEEQDDEFTLQRVTGVANAVLTPGERAVLETLLPDPGSRIEMKQEHYRVFQSARQALQKALQKEYRGRLFQLNRVYLLPPVLMSAAAVVVAAFFTGGPAIWISFGLLTLALHALFIFLLRAPTPAGRRVMDEIEGFRRYLDAAERERLEQMRSPALTPEVFEAFLPYAYALGVENSWCERFARELPGDLRDADSYQPSWYTGRLYGLSALQYLGRDFGGSITAAISSASSAPGSSSGSGGGGSSGGGGGGGGGGGW
ncbi:MAG: DUF2207 domain-containing protein [Xanthomonadales bacterium]|nr:DUF2207 domain-containing protein [Xanthomonadales bacterium]